MDREQVFSMLLILCVCWGCGALFFGIGWLIREYERIKKKYIVKS